MSYFQFNKDRKKAESLNLKPKGIEPLDISKNKPSVSTNGSFDFKKGSALLSGITQLTSNDNVEIDTSGNTDYSSFEKEDVTGGLEKTVSDIGGMAVSGAVVGGPIGAIAGGVLGLGKNLLQGSKQAKELKQAKERFKAKKRYQSKEALNDILEENKKDDIVDENTLNYIENLKQTPGYNRFKRNSQYTI